MALNIMIVDDSPVMRAFIRKVVGLTGLDVGEYCEAGDGEDALRLLRERWMDLVLTDINMPRMNGEEFVRRLESDEVAAGHSGDRGVDRFQSGAGQAVNGARSQGIRARRSRTGTGDAICVNETSVSR